VSEVRAAIFRDGKLVEHVTLDASMPQHENSAFIWIELLNPVDHDFDVLQERFRLHSLAVEDSMSPTQMPKVDVYDDQIFVVLKVARLQNDEIKYAEIDSFVSGRHIITVHHDEDAEYVRADAKFWSGRSPRGPRRTLSCTPSWILSSTVISQSYR
jgi:magnesium transporter